MTKLTLSQALIMFVCVAGCVIVGVIVDQAPGAAIGIAFGAGLSVFINSLIEGRKQAETRRG
jgi:preprotein translocase subunit SecG